MSISGEVWAEDTTRVKALSWGCLGGHRPEEASQARQLEVGTSMGGALGQRAVNLKELSKPQTAGLLGARHVRMVSRLKACGLWLQVARV